MARKSNEAKRAGKPLTVERWPGEAHEHHRALLLFAMQGPMERSARAVARACGVSEGTIRNWRKKSGWDRRIDGQGETADADALDLYRALYLVDFGQIELPHVAPFVVVPIGPFNMEDPVARAQHEARVKAAEVIPAAAEEAEQAVRQRLATMKRDNKTTSERHIKLVDASLGLIARKLKANEIRVSVRDIPVLLETREKLVAVATGEHDAAHGPIVESARVQHARKTGGDLLAAMHEDAQELVAILGALRTSKHTDASTLAAEDQIVRSALASSGGDSGQD